MAVSSDPMLATALQVDQLCESVRCLNFAPVNPLLGAVAAPAPMENLQGGVVEEEVATSIQGVQQETYLSDDGVKVGLALGSEEGFLGLHFRMFDTRACAIMVVREVMQSTF